MADTLKQLELFAKQNNLTVEREALRFGHNRAKISCHSYKEMASVVSKLSRKRNMAIIKTWACSEGEFEGYVYVMDLQAKAEYEARVKEEQARLEDWWQRYHSADIETRRLMACGTIL